MEYPINPVSGNIILEGGLPTLSIAPVSVRRVLELTDLSNQVLVVASGSSLAGSGLGEIIDRFGTVVRINRPRIAGHEEDVGSKTDVIMLFPGLNTAMAMAAENWLPDFMPCKFWLSYPIGVLTTKDVTTVRGEIAVHLQKLLPMYDWSANDFKPYTQGMKLVDAPDLMAVHDELIEIQKRYGYNAPRKGPPTGVKAIILLKQMLPADWPIFTAGYNISYTGHYYEASTLFDESHDVFHDRVVMQAWVDEGSVIPLTLPDDTELSETGHPKKPPAALGKPTQKAISQLRLLCGQLGILLADPQPRVPRWCEAMLELSHSVKVQQENVWRLELERAVMQAIIATAISAQGDT